MGFLLAIAAWVAGVVSVVGDNDGDPTERYFLGVVFAVIGTGIAIVATLYDIAGRHD